MMFAVSELKAGLDLPRLTKPVSQENITRYAEVSRDFNPIHIDADYASKTPLGGTIAHGMLVLAYVSQMMTDAFGRHWVTGGELTVRFKAPARPGDTLTVGGQICQVHRSDDRQQVTCKVFCKNQNGETILTGDTSVRFSKNENSR